MTVAQQAGSLTKTQGAPIDIESITKQYGEFTALKGIDLHIKAGEFMSFLGPSGSGKTTMLNLIAGFVDVTQGNIKINGEIINHLPSNKRNIGVVFQHYALFPHMTVLKNVMYPLTVRGIKSSEAKKQAIDALAMVKLEKFSDRYPSQLSGGQQQRVALARALVFHPPLLLMDEPLGALDKKLREWLQMEIKRIHRELGTTFVYVTHDQEEALALSDRIAIFNRGQIEQVGTGKELYESPATLFVGKFMGESTVIKGRVRHQDNISYISLGNQEVKAHGHLNADTAAILVRPEKITVIPAEQPNPTDQNVLTGEVTECLYMGSNVKYEIRLHDGSIAIARISLTEHVYPIGSTVKLCWDISSSRLLPDNENDSDT